MPVLKPDTQLQTQRIKQQALSNDKARLYMFNVDQGDHFLLKLPDGSYGILDFFYKGRLDQCECPGLTSLKALKKHFPENKINIKFISISHPDLDHITGLRQTFEWLTDNNITIQNVWCFSENNMIAYLQYMSDIIKTISYEGLNQDEKTELKDGKNILSDEIKAIIKLVNDIQDTTGCRFSSIREHNKLIKQNQFEADAIGPLDKHIRTYREAILLGSLKELCSKLNIDNITIDGKKIKDIDKNILSGIILLKIGMFRLLFGGDIDSKPLKECIEDAREVGTNFPAHFVKGIHHGSAHSSTEYIWENILKHDDKIPQHVGISAGYNAKYKHPRQKTIDDITAVTKKRDTITHVNSTNNLKKRLPEEYKKEDIDWIWDDTKEPEDVKETSIFREFSQKTVPDNQEIIGAYIYDFYLNENRIELKIGTTSHLHDSRKMPDKDEKWAIPFHPIIR